MPEQKPVQPAKVDPTRMAPADLAKLLSRLAGEKIPADRIAADVAAGAPTNGDGTLHLVHYAAWLARQVD